MYAFTALPFVVSELQLISNSKIKKSTVKQANHHKHLLKKSLYTMYKLLGLHSGAINRRNFASATEETYFWSALFLEGGLHFHTLQYLPCIWRIETYQYRSPLHDENSH